MKSGVVSGARNTGEEENGEMRFFPEKLKAKLAKKAVVKKKVTAKKKAAK